MDKFVIRQQKDCPPEKDRGERDELNCHDGVHAPKKRKTTADGTGDSFPSEQLVKKWCSLFKWAEVEWKNEVPLLRCKLCVAAKKGNVLASDKGYVVYKVDTLKKHEGSVDHKHAVQAKSLAESKAWQKSVAASISKAEEAVNAAMNIVYLQAKENLATRKFGPLKQLCADLGCSKLLDLNVDEHTNYESYDSVREMEEALAAVIRQKIIDKVKQARWYSLMIDECTDVSVEQSIIIYLKVVHMGKVFTHYLSLNRLEGTTADHLFSCIMATLKMYNIDVSKCSSLATDGAKVMTGVRAGVSALFKEINPHMLSVHCVAHRLALASSQAVAAYGFLVKYQDILNRVYTYFQQSPKNSRMLADVQSILDQRRKKFVQVSATRWLSLGNSVAAFKSNWQALVAVLIEDKRPVAQGLLKQISSYKFLATTALMNDIMFILNKLSLTFQKSDLDFETVQANVTACLAQMEELKSGTGTSLMAFNSAIPSNPVEQFEYQSHIVTDSSKQRDMIKLMMTGVIDDIIENIQERVGDLSSLKIFNIFVPKLMPKDLQMYGLPEIQAMHELFSKTGEFSLNEMLSEWALFKRLLESRCKNMSLKELVQFMHMNEMKEQYPLMTSAIEYAATLPVHTVDCERGFSALNLVKSKIRNRLSLSNVNNTLMINIEGPERNDFNFHQSFELWANAKQRRVSKI